MMNWEKWRSMRIEDCELRIRTRKMCADAGLETLSDVDALDRLELKALGLGMVSINDLRDILLGCPGSRLLKQHLERVKREELEGRIPRLERELAAAKADLSHLIANGIDIPVDQCQSGLIQSGALRHKAPA